MPEISSTSVTATLVFVQPVFAPSANHVPAKPSATMTASIRSVLPMVCFFTIESDLLRREPAVRPQAVAGHKTGLIAGEPDHNVGDLMRFAHAPNGVE
jgi:hypothetical protein